MAMLAQSLDSIIRKADGAFESFDSAMAKIGDVGPACHVARFDSGSKSHAAPEQAGAAPRTTSQRCRLTAEKFAV